MGSLRPDDPIYSPDASAQAAGLEVLGGENSLRA